MTAKVEEPREPNIIITMSLSEAHMLRNILGGAQYIGGFGVALLEVLKTVGLTKR